MTNVAYENFQKLIIPLCHEDGERVGNEPVKNTDHPELEPQAEGCRQCAVDDGDTPGAPPSNMGSVNDRRTGMAKPSI